MSSSETTLGNPILSRDFQIPFSQIQAEHISSGIRTALKRAEEGIQSIIESDSSSYESVLGELDQIIEPLDRTISIAGHLMGVNNSPELREHFLAVQPEFSSFYAKLTLNEGLWQRLKAYSQSEDAKNLNPIKARHLDKTLLQFRRSGAELSPEKKARAETLKVELSKLSTDFANNVLDSTNAFEVYCTEAEIEGLPESAKAAARASAKAKNQEGYRFSLQMPSFLPVMQYAHNRALRQQIYEAYQSRACSEPHDNRPLISKILALRQELAELLGHENFADYNLETNMVKDGTRALNFVGELKAKTLGYWEKEMGGLERFANTHLNLPQLQAWDISYASEKLRKAAFDLDEEELRPYFPLEKVMQGLFSISERIFNIKISQGENPEVWHPEVSFYHIHDATGTHLASFYTDWFPRESKRGGAWMNSFITGGPQEDGSFKPHLGLMIGNFTPPQEDRPALLTHDEVQTTFHEFGHVLHHCLSRVEVADLAGTNVPRDWVELPSQLMENWCWEYEALKLFAHHYQTGEVLPEVLFERMQRARTFMGAHAQLRQLSFGTVDLELHINYKPEMGDVVTYAQKVMEAFQLRPEFAHNHFITGFGHIFSGGYAAGYYSYKWSEVLDADAFSRFQKEGIFNAKTGQDYVDTILSQGYSQDPEVLFKKFMGRDPDPEALIRRNLGEPVYVSV
ncbi:MAG: M3 family metallopeptidase [Deinococcales bacterium]